MFEEIGRQASGNPQRQIGSMLISLCLNSSILWVLILMSSQVVSEVPGQARAHEVTMFELAAPGDGPAPLPPGPGAAPEPIEVATPSAGSDIPPDTEGDAAPVMAEEPGEGKRAGPAAPGIGDDEGGGGGGGGDTGGGGGGGGDHPDGDIISLTVEQVVPLRVVQPRFPEAARALGLEEVRCMADVEIDRRGRPTRVSVRDCPPIYAAAVQAAMMRWRFSPARMEGQAVPARFRQPFRFVLR